MPFSIGCCRGSPLLQDPEEKQRLNQQDPSQESWNKKKFYFENTVFKDKFDFHFPYPGASNKIQKNKQNNNTKTHDSMYRALKWAVHIYKELAYALCEGMYVCGCLQFSVLQKLS